MREVNVDSSLETCHANIAEIFFNYLYNKINSNDNDLIIQIIQKYIPGKTKIELLTFVNDKFNSNKNEIIESLKESLSVAFEFLSIENITDQNCSFLSILVNQHLHNIIKIVAMKLIENNPLDEQECKVKLAKLMPETMISLLDLLYNFLNNFKDSDHDLSLLMGYIKDAKNNLKNINDSEQFTEDFYNILLDNKINCLLFPDVFNEVMLAFQGQDGLS